VKQVKNLQPKQVEAQEYKHRKQTAGKNQRVQNTRRLWGPPINERPSEVQIDTL